MIGYKAFNKDLTCRGFQYEIGKTYEYEGEIKICESGFHFCKDLKDCYNFYEPDHETRICKVEAFGEVLSDYANAGVKFVTNKIKILEEIKEPWIFTNINKNNTGFFNTGYLNFGNNNTGEANTGFRNAGVANKGDNNTGNRNLGNYNTGDCNLGNFNTGNYNYGHFNTGGYNIGNYNTGYFNAGNFNVGCFNTEQQYKKIKMFNKPSDWTFMDFYESRAFGILTYDIPITRTYIASEDELEKYKDKYTDIIKLNNKSDCDSMHYAVTIKKTDKDRQDWWDNILLKREKEEIMSLPNFDANIFYECTGIKVDGFKDNSTDKQEENEDNDAEED